MNGFYHRSFGIILPMTIAGLLLAGCNSTESALDIQNTTPATQPVTAMSNAAGGNTAGGNAAATVLPDGKLQIAPIIGAPLNVATPLTHRLLATAKARNIPLASSNEAAAYMLKGYFSAMPEDGTTTVLYVWDVLDASGNRLHRIQGREQVKGESQDTWSIVPASAMEAIADRTLGDFTSWRSGTQNP